MKQRQSGRQTLLFSLAAAAVLLASVVCSQANSFRVTNAALHARKDVVRLNLPWAKGVYHGEPLAVDGELVQVEPFGAKWPDGSWRYSTVYAPVELEAGKPGVPYETVVSVSLAAPTIRPPAFEATQGLILGLQGFDCRLRVGKEEFRAQPSQSVSAGHLSVAVACAGRVPNTPVHVRLVLDARSGCDHVRFWLRYGTSDPTDPELSWELPKIELAVAGVGVWVEFDESKVLERRIEGGRTVLTLDRGGRWGEGQAQMLSGRFLCAPIPKPGDMLPLHTLAAEHQAKTEAVATTWPKSGTFGPSGGVPEAPQPLDNKSAASFAAALYRQPDHPWAPQVLGSNVKPKDTGAQASFGPIALHRPALGWPAELAAWRRSAYQDSIRPVWFFEADGSPVTYSNHPRLHAWFRAPFWTSPDKLGKKKAPDDAEYSRYRHASRGGYPLGRDREHDVRQPEQELLMLTADRGMQMLFDSWVEMSLAAYTVSSGNGVIDAPGAPRSVGRGLKGLAMDYLLSGREDVRRCIDARCSMIARVWPGKDSAPLKFLEIKRPDGRNLGGRIPFGFFWQDLMGVEGLTAAWLVTGSPDARAVALACGSSMVNTKFLRAPATQGQPWNTPKNIGQPSATWDSATNRWKGIGVEPQPVLGGDPVVEYYSPFGRWVLPGVECLALLGADQKTLDKAQAFIDFVEPGLQNWNHVRWTAVR